MNTYFVSDAGISRILRWALDHKRDIERSGKGSVLRSVFALVATRAMLSAPTYITIELSQEQVDALAAVDAPRFLIQAPSHVVSALTVIDNFVQHEVTP